MLVTITSAPSGLGSKIAAGSSPLTPLLKDAVLLGGIYNLDYDSAIVVTNDIDKRRAGGVPKHGFLLAAGPQDPMNPAAMPLDEDEVEDDELVSPDELEVAPLLLAVSPPELLVVPVSGAPSV